MRRTRLLLLLALALAGASLLVLWPRTPSSTTAEQPLPPPVAKPRQPPLQADAEGYYVPGYSFTVNGFRFTGFSLRPEALVTFAQTTVPCLEALGRFFGGEAREPLGVLLAEDGTGCSIGLAELSIRADAEGCHSDRVAYLEGWFVVPKARGHGVGRALVAAAEEWGRSQGCCEFASDSRRDNEVSAAAHRALGFIEVGLIRCFRKDL